KIHANTRRILVEVGEQLTPEQCAELGIDPEKVCIVPAEAYRQACRPLVERTVEVLAQLEREWAEETGREPTKDLARVYVVGGASSLPFVSRRLRELYGRRAHRPHYPASAIAIGLAIALDKDAGFQVTERFFRQLRVFRESVAGERVEFDVICDASIELPRDAEYHEVRRRYAPAHNLGHYRYVECGWLDAQGTPSGDITSFSDVLFPFDPSLRSACNLHELGVLRAERPVCEVEERYKVARNGIVELTIRDVHTGFERTHKLTSVRAN